MCLLIFSWHPGADDPLVVAANRDERLERPAEAFGILQPGEPRILGGRDLMAGGTWLAVNEFGVVAGLTNRPSAAGRDDTKRSRGELPLIATRQPDAGSAVDALVAAVEPGHYNPGAMLVADRSGIYAVEFAPDEPLVVTPLEPGLHVLENLPYGRPSAKVDLVTSALTGRHDLWDGARIVLADHTLTASSEDAGAARAGGDARHGETPGGETPDEAVGVSATSEPVRSGAGSGRSGRSGRSGPAASWPEDRVGPVGSVEPDLRPRVLADGTLVRPAGTSACCVHLEEYGTRSSALIRVPSGKDRAIDILAADGPPCVTPFQERSGLWHAVPRT